MTIKFGADPEYFVGMIGDTGVLEVVPPAYFQLKGLEVVVPDKKHPVFQRESEFMIHRDGVAFEIGVEPEEKWERMLEHCYDAQDALEKMVSKYDFHTGLHPIPTIGFDPKRWLKLGESFFDTTIFGCDPDEDVDNLEAACRTVDVTTHPYRYAGGHIHLSGHKIFRENPHLAIQILKMTAGCAAVGYSPVPELEKLRTFMYGRPGKFRLQQYKNGEVGVEYRTPSVTWSARGNRSVAEKVFNAIDIAIRYFDLPRKAEDVYWNVFNTCNEAILECKQDSAKQILAFVEGEL